jgi:L-rhamnose-H+ transport protein
MQPNPLLGVVFHWLGGLASGSFYVPYKGVRKWSWETFWLAGGMFSWLICPWIGALLLTKDLLPVLHETSAYTFWMTYLMGVLWGLGGLTFGLTTRYLGMSLGMAVALGYCATFGTLVPPIVKGECAAKLLQTHGGNICFLGVLVCLVGIAIGGIAGVRKERDMGNDGKSSAIAEFSLWIFSTLWGIFFKEWRGAKAFTKFLVVVMLAFLVGSTVIIGWGNKISEDAASAATAPAGQHPQN